MVLIPDGYQENIIDRWALAADLGQSNDPTAIAVIQHRIVSHTHWRGGITKISEHFDCRHLARLPLGLSYVDQVGEVGRLLLRPPLKDGCEFSIDATGVGRAVADLFNDLGMRPTQVTITAGDKATSAGDRRWHVPKGVLISTLDARLHTGGLRFAAALTEAGTMAEELKDFQRHVSAAGRYSYDARSGKHDDLVLAVAIALWSLIGKPKPPMAMVGTYHGGHAAVR